MTRSLFRLTLLAGACLWSHTIDPTQVYSQSCAVEPPSLTAWWAGDGTSHDIRGARHGNLMGGATFASGLVGDAFALNGVGAYVEVPHDASLNVGSGDFSVDLWVNFNSTSGEQVLIEKWIDGGSGSGWTLTKLAGNQIQLAMFGTGNPTSSPQSIPTGTWIHVAARRSGGTAAVFLNGTQIVSGAVSSNLDSPTSLKIGRRGDGRGFFLKGRVDEVHLYVGRALSNAEITAIHAAGAAGVCVDPVCGDGARQGDEECDDGNLTEEDGCENDCTLSCGNGTQGGDEECDDGNREDDDGCDSNCTTTRCGNGVVTSGEACDDGNGIDGDGCDRNCTWTACGNGIRTANTGEQCDDGNLASGDGCQSDCRITPIETEIDPGGTVSTDPHGVGATEQIPIQVALTSPNGGTVAIATSDHTLTPAGVRSLVQDLLIQAPSASVESPLRIVLRIDVSAIPPGVDLLRIDLSRDGFGLLDCTGPEGHAVPDPCLESREELDDGDIVMTGLTSKASRWNATVRGLNKAEQRCVSGAYKAAQKVMKAQASVNAACLKAAASGKGPDVATCVSADAGGKVAKARATMIAYVAKACSSTPPFGFEGASEANEAAETAVRDLLVDLLGDPNSAVIVDKARAQCQAAVLKQWGKVLDAKFKIFSSCAARGFAGKSTLFIANTELVRCFDAVDADEGRKAAKSMGKLAGALLKSCSTNAAVALPGTCASVDDRSSCLETRLDCRLCRMLNATSGSARDCDVFDDGEGNGSCS